MENLDRLLKEYHNAPEIYKAGKYWKAYEDKIVNEIKQADLEQLRSGKYPIFNTFGFSDLVYTYRSSMPLHEKLIKKIIRKYFINKSAILPYSLNLTDIREMAFNHCLLQGQLAGAIPISAIEADTYGNPTDIFKINGKSYTMQFLNYYIRYCFVQRILKLKGNETIVELGSGSGLQIEVLKKIYPDLTILCFDLPAPLFLCEHYLSHVLGDEKIVKSNQTINLTNLDNFIEKGKVHLFGNWKFPLLKSFKFYLFWNAASFGEMEPHIVKNYLSLIQNNCEFLYLLQARSGKESFRTSGVVTPINYNDYNSMLYNYDLVCESDAFEAHRKMTRGVDYFQAVWEKNKYKTVTTF